MGYRNAVVLRSLVSFAASFWAYLSALFFPLFRAVHKLFFRYEQVEDPLRNFDENQETVNPGGVSVQEQGKTEAEEPEPAAVEYSVSESTLEGVDETESPKMFLSFKFPSFEEFTTNHRANDNYCEFVSRDSLSEEEEEEEEEEVFSCSAKELSPVPSSDCSSEGDFDPKIEISAKEFPTVSSEKDADAVVVDANISQVELLKELKSQFILEKVMNKQFQFKFEVMSERDFLVSDSDTDSMSSSHDFSIMSRLLDSNSDGFSSDGDEDLREELRKLEESSKEIRHEEINRNKPEKEEEEGEEADEEEEEENHSSENSIIQENAEAKLEVEWEHQELIEQLRMEIRKVKATGLPTIAEDSESPRITDDLKPWRIDEKFHKGDRISELHKVYKGYRERMRKFDILNYQKMYALGFLRTKDPFKSISTQKSSTPSISSVLSQTLRLCREDKKSDDNPMTNFAKELHADLEIVYVGQLCLSWEFLHWQYEKALELWDSDPYSMRRYNEVANEFQQLQVLMIRFLENERFEGPRVQYYVKNRCFLRNLLQVPVIREDNVKVKKKKIKGEFGVSSDVLVEILEESIRIFWWFIRADKDASGSVHKGRNVAQPGLEDRAVAELFSKVHADLQKKEKKLNEVMKGGNWILSKFQRHRHDQEEADGYSSSSSGQVLAFFSQVDMKLIRRVLNMSRLTADQLAWCSSKLSRIKFVQRRIHVEPEFLLFPC